MNMRRACLLAVFVSACGASGSGTIIDSGVTPSSDAGHDAAVGVDRDAGSAHDDAGAGHDAAVPEHDAGSPEDAATQMPSDPSPEDVALHTLRATLSWEALVQTLGAATPGQFFDHEGSQDILYVWPHGQVAAAALDLARLSRDGTWFDRTMEALALYELGAAYAPAMQPADSSNVFFDDNGMVGLLLLQSLAQTGKDAFLARAEQTFEFMTSGEATGGGVYWNTKDARKLRGISASGSALEYALRLFLLTHDPK